MPDNVVTVVAHFEPGRLDKEAAMRHADLIVVDCATQSEAATSLLKAIRAVKRRFPRLLVILMYHRLAHAEIAEAYKVGVEDVFSSDFPSPGRARLLAEKIEALCRRRRG
jgi:DNA-binding NarL/FixJ family response regulator